MSLSSSTESLCAHPTMDETIMSPRLQGILDSLTWSYDWDVKRFLSVRRDTCVCVVSGKDASSPRVIRISPDTESHATFEFTEFWSTVATQYLPAMESPRIIGFGDGEDNDEDFVLEEYEFVEQDLYRQVLSNFNDQVKWKYLLDVTKGVETLSRMNWCHGDLSLENVICHSQGAKLIDFESTLSFAKGISYQTTEFGPNKPLYRPPELDSNLNLVSPSEIDIWSVGVMLFLLGTKKFPFSDDIEERRDQFEFLYKFGFHRYVDEEFGGQGVQKQLGPLLMDLLNGIFVVFNKSVTDDGFFMVSPSSSRRRMNPTEVACHPFFDEFR